MQIINYKIKRNIIFYEVLTKGNNTFTHELYKDTPTRNVRKILKLIEEKIDNHENFRNDKI